MEIVKSISHSLPSLFPFQFDSESTGGGTSAWVAGCMTSVRRALTGSGTYICHGVYQLHRHLGKCKESSKVLIEDIMKSCRHIDTPGVAGVDATHLASAIAIFVSHGRGNPECDTFKYVGRMLVQIPDIRDESRAPALA